MDRRFLTVLGVSLVFALVVSSVFYQMTARRSGRQEDRADRQEGRGGGHAPAGCGRDGQARRRQSGRRSPREAFPKGAFSKVEDVLDRPVISNILLDEPLLEGRLAVKGSGLGLAPDHSRGHARGHGARERCRRRGRIRSARHARRRAGDRHVRLAARAT